MSMSYGTIHAGFGTQFQTSTTQGPNRLGTRMVLPDGRVYRYSNASGTALVAGNVIQQAAAVSANFDALAVAAAVAAGTNSITITLGATATTEDLFKEGYLNIEDDAGEGYIYTINDHDAAAGSAVQTLVLEGDETFQEALTTSTTVGLHLNLYKDVIQMPTVETGAPIGVAVSDIPANGFGWIQTWGPCSVLTDGTLVLGQHVRVSDGVAGAVENLDRDGTAEDEPAIGYCLAVEGDTEHSLIQVTLSP